MNSSYPNKWSATSLNADNDDRKKRQFPEPRRKRATLQLFAPTSQIPACHQEVLNDSIGRIAALLTEEYAGQIDFENRKEKLKELLLRANDEIRELGSERKRLENEIKEKKQKDAPKKSTDEDGTKDLRKK